jgi:hypothetical protein
MTGRPIRVPKSQKQGVFALARFIWTTPTTSTGRLLARLSGCGVGERIGGPAVAAYLYRLPQGRLRGLGAIAIGHAIVVEPEFLAGREEWILAHELSHALQHDWLGPAYLVTHALFQLVSAIASGVRPISGFPPQHAYNPLERRWLCVPFDVLVAKALPSGAHATEVLSAFGLAD